MEFERFQDLTDKPVVNFIQSPLDFPLPQIVEGGDGASQPYIELKVVSPGRGRKGVSSTVVADEQTLNIKSTRKDTDGATPDLPVL